MLLPLLLSNGSSAQIVKGGFHVLYDGQTYLNFNDDTGTPHIFPPNAVGKLTDDNEIEVEFHGASVLLPKAETLVIPVENSAVQNSTLTYTLGSFHLEYQDKKYLLTTNMPLLQLERTVSADIDGNEITLGYYCGRCRARYVFELETKATAGKRKRLDRTAEEEHDKAVKRETVAKKYASKVRELAQTALDSIKELKALEQAACKEAGSDAVFSWSFGNAMGMLSDAVKRAEELGE
jgi:hypothetical protein